MKYDHIFAYQIDPVQHQLNNVASEANIFADLTAFSNRISPNNPITILYPFTQPNITDRLCQNDFCSELCLPNGHGAKFSCLCFNYSRLCYDYGQYYNKATSTWSSSSTTQLPNQSNIEHSNFSHSIFLQHSSKSTGIASNPYRNKTNANKIIDNNWSPISSRPLKNGSMSSEPVLFALLVSNGGAKTDKTTTLVNENIEQPFNETKWLQILFRIEECIYNNRFIILTFSIVLFSMTILIYIFFLLAKLFKPFLRDWKQTNIGSVFNDN